MHPPSGGQMYLAEEGIQHPGSVQGEVGAGTEHWEVEAQEALMEARARPQSHSGQWAAVGEPEIRAAKWMAVEAVGGPGTMQLAEGQGGPAWRGPCPNRSC